MSDDKKPILWDMDYGLTATFEEEEWNNNRETDYVRVKYFPFNTLPIFNFKKCEYPAPISRRFIYPINVPVQSGLVGQPKQLYIIYRADKQGIMVKILNDTMSEKITQLMGQISDLQKENAKLKAENQDAKISVSKSVKQAESITGKSSSQPEGVTPFGGFNNQFRPPYSGFQQ